MANTSAIALDEECSDEKTTLIVEEDSDPILFNPNPSTRIRDFSLVAIGITAIALILVLLTRFHISPIFSQFPSFGDTPRVQASCPDPPLRREWRALTEEEKLDFISAIRCLALKPSKLGLQTTRYDDFVYVHIKLYSDTHNIAPSLPWHRYYIKVFENALREECDFQGQLPYWDWTLDATKPEKSPIWSVTDGFGGNGVEDSHCVENGLFANLEPQYPHRHCLQRDFIPGMVGFNYTIEKIRDLWQNTTSYHDFRMHLESGAHKSVHNGIGGEMPTDYSPNDPIFFVHHAQIDRIWWYWQQLQPKRLEDYFGPRNNSEPNALSQATLQDLLPMMNLDNDRAVADLMDTKSTLLCYKY